jgi:hypothetical protein
VTFVVKKVVMSNYRTPVSILSRLAAILAGIAAMFTTAAIDWRGKSPGYQANMARLAAMDQDQRRAVCQKYQDFLGLPRAEQDRIRLLSDGVQQLPADKRARYRGIMDRYMKWKSSLPLYQQQMLVHAAHQGSTELYANFRDVQARNEVEDRLRAYWFIPDAPPGIRKAVPRILAKLSPEEIEELDQTPPLDRTEKLLVAGQRAGVELPPAGSGRPWLRGQLPRPDPARFEQWLQNLPREQLEELADLGFMKKARERQLLQLYYRHHPEEYRMRMRKPDAVPPGTRPNERAPRNPPSDAAPPPMPQDRNGAQTKGTGKQLGIPPK